MYTFDIQEAFPHIRDFALWQSVCLSIAHIMATTLRLNKSTTDRLKEAKIALGLGSQDDVVNYLLDECLGQGAQDGSDDDDDGSGAEDGDADENARVPQLVTCETLLAEEKAIKYWTGLKRPAFDWVLQALSEAVRQACVFCASLARPLRATLSLLCWCL